MDNIVAGMVQRYVGGQLRNRACVWLSDVGGKTPFTVTLMPETVGGTTLLSSVARAVNSSMTVVGNCSFRDAGGRMQWRGFILQMIGFGTPTFFNVTPASDGLSTLNPAWVVTGIKAINNAGWMLGTARRGFSVDQDVLLIPNGLNPAVPGGNATLFTPATKNFDLLPPNNG
jgi:hypothetical protein